jgi:cytochrome b6-f complex iron-sulfur subunit
MNRRRSNRDAATDAVADDRPIPLGRLDDPEEIEALRAAIALQAARPDAGEPTAAFVDRLHHELTAPGTTRTVPQGVSRRAIITGAIAAGSVAAGVGIGLAVDQSSELPAAAPARGPLDPTDGEWVAVADADAVEAGTVRFEQRGVIGFVSSNGASVQAVSGVCTHLGCVLRANDSTGRLDCPCHRTSFDIDGTVARFQLATKPAPLPALRVRRADRTIEVLLPPASQ